MKYCSSVKNGSGVYGTIPGLVVDEARHLQSEVGLLRQFWTLRTHFRHDIAVLHREENLFRVLLLVRLWRWALAVC